MSAKTKSRLFGLLFIVLMALVALGSWYEFGGGKAWLVNQVAKAAKVPTLTGSPNGPMADAEKNATRSVNPSKFANDKTITYGDANNNVQSPADLIRMHNLHQKLLYRGGVYMPVQAGAPQGLNANIYEGTSDRALSYGAGTAKAGQVMGKQNYALSGHNFGSGSPLMFSPLQRVNANERPFIYLSDGIKYYKYKVNSQEMNPKGYRVVNWQRGDVVENDAQSAVKPRITLTTCDERDVFSLHPVNRIIITGELVGSGNLKSAPTTVQNGFGTLLY